MPRKRLPRISAVAAARAPFTLLIQWETGEETLVDVSGTVDSFRIYAPLRRAPGRFRKVRVGAEGTDVVWTTEIDMSADTLWRLAQEQSGAIMTAAAFHR